MVPAMASNLEAMASNLRRLGITIQQLEEVEKEVQKRYKNECWSQAHTHIEVFVEFVLYYLCNSHEALDS